MKKNFLKFIIFILFVIYCTFMLILLFDRNIVADGTYKELIEGKINLVPFQTIKLFLRVLESSSDTYSIIHALSNLLGNVVLFIPMGIFMPYLYKSQNNFFVFLLTHTAIISLVELTQLVTLRGSLDIDDLILNMIGIIFGFILYQTIKFISKKISGK